MTDEQKVLRSNMGKALTQEQFQQIKDLHFKGYSKPDIGRQVHRGASTVDMVLRVNTLEEYFEITREYWRSVKAKAQGKQPDAISLAGVKSVTPYKQLTTITKPQERYGRVAQFKEKFDEVLMEFILEEVEIKYTEIINENKHLKGEVTKLKNRLEQYENPNFGKKLEDRLAGKESSALNGTAVSYE